MGYPVGHMEDQTEMDNGYWYIVVHHVRTTARHVIHSDLQILTYHILSQKAVLYVINAFKILELPVFIQ